MCIYNATPQHFTGTRPSCGVAGGGIQEKVAVSPCWVHTYSPGASSTARLFTTTYLLFKCFVHHNVEHVDRYLWQLLVTTYLRSPALIQVPTAAWLSGSWNITLLLPPSVVTLATLGR